jgi:hypothetical protein
VNAKYFANADNFKPGYVTPNDNWDNYWRSGHNRVLGWGWGTTTTTGTGTGAKSLGEEFANSEAFANCQVQKVFKAVCFRAPQNAADRARAATIAQNFRSNGYRLKGVFAETAAYCMGN